MKDVKNLEDDSESDYEDVPRKKTSEKDEEE